MRTAVSHLTNNQQSIIYPCTIFLGGETFYLLPLALTLLLFFVVVLTVTKPKSKTTILFADTEPRAAHIPEPLAVRSRTFGSVLKEDLVDNLITCYDAPIREGWAIYYDNHS